MPKFFLSMSWVLSCQIYIVASQVWWLWAKTLRTHGPSHMFTYANYGFACQVNSTKILVHSLQATSHELSHEPNLSSIFLFRTHQIFWRRIYVYKIFKHKTKCQKIDWWVITGAKIRVCCAGALKRCSARFLDFKYRGVTLRYKEPILMHVITHQVLGVKFIIQCKY